MIDTIKKHLAPGLVAGAVIIGCLWLARLAEPKAAAQTTGGGTGTISGFVASPNSPFTALPTNLSLTVTNNASNSAAFNVVGANGYTNFGTNGATFVLRPGYGFSVGAFITNNSSDDNSNVYITFARSLDGGGYDCLSNYTAKFTLQGTSNYYTTNWPWANVDGYYSIQVQSLSNGTADPIGLQLELARPIPWKPGFTGL